MSDKQLAVQCVQMLEKYLGEVKKLPNDNSKTISLETEDMSEWKKTYYPQLVKNNKIRDGIYFQNPLKDLNYGIGVDGVFTKWEYLQFMWSAYKFILGDFTVDRNAVKYLRDCIYMLEPYSASFENHGTEAGIYADLNKNDKGVWNRKYYKDLVATGLVPDGSFFEGTAPSGIGTDAHFNGEELCHFLYRLYRLVYTILN